jgi:hypothetical protein
MYAIAAAAVSMLALAAIAAIVIYATSARPVQYIIDPALACVAIERGEWHDIHGCILQEI